MGNLFSNHTAKINIKENKTVQKNQDEKVQKNQDETVQKNQDETSTQINQNKILTHVKLKKDYDLTYIQKYKISKNLEIKFKNSFNDQITEKLIDKFRLYDKIIFGFSFNQELKNKIPSNIIYIQFGHNFNRSISNLMIFGEQENILEELVLGEKFNQSVNNMSPNLKRISFGYDFNHPVENLPTNIEYIKFGHEFNQNIDYLPCALKYIIFGFKFNQSIDNIPSSIIYIELGSEFNKSINYIHPNIKKMKLNKDYYDKNKVQIDNITLANEFIEISF